MAFTQILLVIAAHRFENFAGCDAADHSARVPFFGEGSLPHRGVGISMMVGSQKLEAVLCVRACEVHFRSMSLGIAKNQT